MQLTSGWLSRLVASRSFQSWAARFPLTRGAVKREGEALFDLVAGFCHSQVLYTVVTLDLPGRLLKAPASVEVLAEEAGVPPERMVVLLRAAAALGLLTSKKGLYRLTRRGAALAGVPGLKEMILHHDVLYRDLADPVAFFRGETETELAGVWPYVFGDEAAPPEVIERYSALMEGSQALVAEDVLRAISLKDVECLMDVGGGTGAFLIAAGKANPATTLWLVDLPEVAELASVRLAAAGMEGRSSVFGGSFLDDALPGGADAVSLVRVLYDHDDDTVRVLLGKVHDALPPEGRLIIAEPMSGGDAPERAGDAYFALYTMAMRTGKTRSSAEIAELCREAGFDGIEMPRPRRPFVTRIVTAVR
ncbi:methyltransferase [Aestuariibius sp. 2305UL40-4]|uniref:methyltransferase n=1 Tax=Aestuariibius violaceus TaxID=3234132 RepID=UPI00348DFAD4